MTDFSCQKEKTWTDDIETLLRIVGDMLLNMLERKKSRELLRLSEEKYRSLFEKSKDVVFFSSPEGKFLDIKVGNGE